MLKALDIKLMAMLATALKAYKNTQQAIAV